MAKKETSSPNDKKSNLQDHNKRQMIDDIIRLHSRDVYLLAYSYVKDHASAEDISQEVFLKCYKFLGNFRGDSSLKSWLFRITVNTSKDFLRKRRFKVFNLASHFFENIRNTEDTEETFLKKQENEQLLQTILSLNSKYREVIILYYFQELTTEEIGGMLKVNHNTVKTRLARGRSLLKEMLDPDIGGVFHG